MNNKKIITVLKGILFLSFTWNIIVFKPLNGQNLTAIGIEGEVYVSKSKEGRNIYEKLHFGPVENIDKIIVKEKSKVKLVNEINHVSLLDKFGEYKVSDIIFVEPENTSMFFRLCNYFKSFFTNHDNAESKANYKNTVYAISRGKMGPPSLDFPLESVLPYGRLGAMPFIWTHDCEDCTYKVNIYEFASKALIYSISTKEKSAYMDNSENILKKNTKYYWSVSIEDQNISSDNRIFTMSQTADFEDNISDIRNEVAINDNDPNDFLTNVAIMTQLESHDKINYALLYGFYLRDRSSEGHTIGQLVDRMWYDALYDKYQE